jgi:hypothetical protein
MHRLTVTCCVRTRQVRAQNDVPTTTRWRWYYVKGRHTDSQVLVILSRIGIDGATK